MLLYANDRLVPDRLRGRGRRRLEVRRSACRIGGGWRHFLNPSNFGIASRCSLFPWVGIAPPYQFTENLHGVWRLVPARS